MAASGTLSPATASLPGGEKVTIRLVRPDDAVRLGRYFDELSAETRSRYAPHPLDSVEAAAICASLDPGAVLRVVATVPEGDDERLIAYLLVWLGVRESDGARYAALGIRLDPVTAAALAPSVADDWQDRGVASAAMTHLLPELRRLGRRQLVLWGGVLANNARARHCYTKWGFREVGAFGTEKPSFDMILDL